MKVFICLYLCVINNHDIWEIESYQDRCPVTEYDCRLIDGWVE